MLWCGSPGTTTMTMTLKEEWSEDLAEWESENQSDNPDRIPGDSAWYSLAKAKMTHHMT
jgi:hypothetical protein